MAYKSRRFEPRALVERFARIVGRDRKERIFKAIAKADISKPVCRWHGKMARELVQPYRKGALFGTDEVDLHRDDHGPAQALVDA